MIKNRLKDKIDFKVREQCTLLDFIMKAFDGISRNSAKSYLSHRRVFVGSRVETRHDFVLSPGMSVSISRRKGLNEMLDKRIKLLYEDKYLIVIDKPSGLLTVASEKEKEKTAFSFVNRYAHRAFRGQAYVVHRLDKDTSGVLVFAKDVKTKTKLQENWNSLVQTRGYIAVVSGRMEKERGTVRSWLKVSGTNHVYSSHTEGDGDLAITNYRTLESNGSYSLVRVEIETGRRNQIRVHMNDLGHPVVGDKKYGNGDNPIRRLALHAFKLTFRHPVTNEMMNFETPYPNIFTSIFK